LLLENLAQLVPGIQTEQIGYVSSEDAGTCVSAIDIFLISPPIPPPPSDPNQLQEFLAGHEDGAAAHCVSRGVGETEELSQAQGRQRKRALLESDTKLANNEEGLVADFEGVDQRLVRRIL